MQVLNCARQRGLVSHCPASPLLEPVAKGGERRSLAALVAGAAKGRKNLDNEKRGSMADRSQPINPPRLATMETIFDADSGQAYCLAFNPGPSVEWRLIGETFQTVSKAAEYFGSRLPAVTSILNQVNRVARFKACWYSERTVRNSVALASILQAPLLRGEQRGWRIERVVLGILKFFAGTSCSPLLKRSRGCECRGNEARI